MAADFDADTDEIDAGAWGIDGPQSFTIGMWVYVDSFGGSHPTDARFISKSNGTAENNHDWMIGQIASGGQKWRVRMFINGSANTVVGTSSMQAFVWYFVLLDYDGSTIHLMINDETEFDTAPSSTGDLRSSNRDIFIGNNTGDDKAPNGAISNVFVLSTLLDSQQKTLLSRGFNIDQIGVSPSNIEAWYKMDRGSDLGFDSGPNARHGTPSGVTWRPDPVLVRGIDTRLDLGSSISGGPLSVPEQYTPPFSLMY